MNKFSLLVPAAILVSGAAMRPVPASADPAAPQTIGMQGAMLPNFAKVDIESPHVYDYTFSSAPTDWRVQSGIWEMTNRWACSPGWSWFGGRSDEIASIWSKRKFSGDFSVQMYCAFKMGLNGTPSWPEHPADVGLTIGGDGQNIASGYSFIVGADNNARSELRKGADVLAQSSSDDALLPGYTDGNPDRNHDFAVIHRRWWYVRIDKIGSNVLCYLDNKLLFQYVDPKPLDAGQVAIWTYNNGIMLSRVQIYYDKEIKPVYVKATITPNTKELAAAPSAAPKFAQTPR